MPKVFLSAGHGGSDPGAVSNGLYEKEINLVTLLSCKSELERHGITVLCSRILDEDDPVNQEVKEANSSKADIAISFHVNAGGGDGFEAYYYPSSKEGKKLASLCEKHVRDLGQNSRGIKETSTFRFIKATTMPSVLVESFFIDNKKDLAIGDSISKQQAFGIAYAKAIIEYFGIAYKKVNSYDKKVYKVQVGAYNDKTNAELMRNKLKEKGFEAVIVI